MELIFLGTSSGVPTKTRNVSAIAVKQQHSKAWILVDCGEGTQHQLLHISRLSLFHLTALCITHVHGDHCYGLPGLLASATMSGRTTSLIIIAPRGIKELVENIQKITRMKLSFEIQYILIDQLTDVIELEEFNIEVCGLSHRVPSYAYVFTENKLPHKLNIEKLKEHGVEPGSCWGQLQRGQDVQLPDGKILLSNEYTLPLRSAHKVIVAGDNDNPWLLATAAENADILVHESTYTENIAKKVGKAPQHSTARQVAEFAHAMSIPYLILTHFSPRYQASLTSSPCIKEIELEARHYYRGNLYLANDFDVYALDRAGALRQLTSK